MSLIHALVGAVVLAFVLLLAGCQSGPRRGQPPMPLAAVVDVDRFMGTWYVHGYTPTPIDPAAHNPTETYRRRDDGKIATTYRFNAGSFDGEEKVYHPVGRVHDPASQAERRMTFFGLITSPYLILAVDEAYETTVIGHPNRKLAWIMTRSPEISDETYERLRTELVRRDFDLSKLQRATHRPPQP